MKLLKVYHKDNEGEFMSEHEIREFQNRLEDLKAEKIRIEEKIKLTEKEKAGIEAEMKKHGVTPENVSTAIKDLEVRIEKGEGKLSKALTKVEEKVYSST